MKIVKVISETVWTITRIDEGVIRCLGMDDGEPISIELSYDDFSAKDHDKIKPKAVVKEIEFYEDDEDGNRNHVILMKFAKEK
jgi:hypothetical protein